MTALTAPARTAALSRGEQLTGVTTLVRLLLRRDRIRLPAWVGGLGLFVVYIGTALPGIAPTDADLRSMVTVFTQPVGRLFTGPAFGMDAPTYARFFAAGYAPYLFLLAGLMNILAVTRYTRVEEQTGRAELVRASVTGRVAALTAGLLVAAVTNVAAAVVVALLAIGAGFAVTGSVLVALGTAATGMAFAGITAVTVQLSEYSRSAAGLAGLALGVSFVLRALGDMAAVGGSALSWASPLGWPAQTAPYVDNRWTPLLPLVGLAAVTIAAAYVWQARRDLGAGLIATRAGQPHAGRWLGSALGLAVRLHRGAFAGWGAAIVLLGVTEGAFTQALVDAGSSMPPALRDLLGAGGLAGSYLAFLAAFTSVVIAAYTVFALQTARADETHGRADLVLATPTSRVGWLSAHGIAVAVGAIVMAAATGLGTGLAAGAVTGQWRLLLDGFAAHLGLVPPIVFLVGVWVALVGWAPRLLAGVGWALVTLTAIVAFFADLLRLPAWLVALSPFEQVAQLPQQPFAVTPVAVLLALAAALATIGFVGIQRRQINAA